MNRPILSFHSNVSPYSELTSLVFSQSIGAYSGLSTQVNSYSDDNYLRIYNNWGLTQNIATAYNVQVTTYDQAVIHGFSTNLVSQHWVSVCQTGFGEGVSTPGSLTNYPGSTMFIGAYQQMMLAKGSDGSLSSIIRANSSGSGAGFAELKTNVLPPTDALAGTYTFVLSVGFNWVP
jgi:hypothetical protein